ncbi:MAG: DUF1015 domain-containing protein [Lachnospiraceae bacterium]|nr:DUF1015 domain-containing protein [Lachnospiraceae bacterium]
MADIRPFKAVRPRADLAADIAAPPYDVYTRQEAKKETEKAPLSFLRIDRAETNFPDDVDTYDDRVYDKAREIMEEMIHKGEFISDDKPCFYLYELTLKGRSQTGIVAVASASDYENGVIKKHENTTEDTELDRIRHVDRLSAQTGPIFLGYRHNDVLSSITARVKQGEPVYDFISPDGVGHRVFVINDDMDIAAIRGAFDGIGDIYICDGHHRCASAVKVCRMRRESSNGSSGEEEYNYFLSVLFPADELLILDYNRVIKDLNGLSESRFMDRIRKKFEITEKGEKPYKPEKRHEFGLYISGRWYCLKAKEELFSGDPVDDLDVSILQNELLSPILNIEDPRTDPRISFVGGVHGMQGLMDRVDGGGYVCAFSLYPTDINELFTVADMGRLMPPKSTWFEPKLRSGLFIHRF